MEFLNQTYQWLHPATHVPPGSLSAVNLMLLIVKRIISLIGSLVIFVGVVIGAYRFSIARFFPKYVLEKGGLDIDFIRRDLGRTIILGLEFIIAADVIETTTAPDYYSVGILGLIVVIRTFLSFTLTREISLLSPMQQNKLKG